MNRRRFATLTALNQSLTHCVLCPRLRRHCENVSRQRRPIFAHERYWGKPVPGFGDRHARLLLVGLAPGAHSKLPREPSRYIRGRLVQAAAERKDKAVHEGREPSSLDAHLTRLAPAGLTATKKKRYSVFKQYGVI